MIARAHKSYHMLILEKQNYFSESGQTLVEVVVAAVIITLILVALVSAITFSLSNVQYARNKALATKYAQEAVEWLRSQRDAGWYTFNGMAPDTATTYCVSGFPANVSSLTSGACTSCPSGCINDDYGIFQREVILTGNVADDGVNITVKVFWQQGQRTEQVIVNTYLTKWI